MQELLQDVRLYEQLLRIDQELASTARKLGCPLCRGRLDSARYSRKPRGGPVGLGEAYDWMLSLCCDACRKRVRPPSVRFLDRRVYFGAVVVLVMAMREGLTSRRLTRLKDLLGVDRRTVHRWRRWWREAFCETEFWRAGRGRLMPEVAESELPRSLLACFDGSLRQRLISTLRFLCPLTTRTQMAS